MSTELSYASGPADTGLLGITIGDMLDAAVARYSANEALVARHQGIRWTYAEFGSRVDELARALMALGVAKGERVGIWSTNRAEWTLTQFATSKLGAILVNVNPSYQASELEYALNQSGCRYLVLTDVFKTTNYNQILESIAPEITTGVPGALKLARVPQLEVVITLGSPRKGMLSWIDVLARAGEVSADALAQRQRELSFEDPINIQYTSGTTGFPKGATLSHHNILNNGYFVARLMNFSHKDRLVIPVPLYHCFGMVMGNLGCITHGATMIYPDPELDEAGNYLQAHVPFEIPNSLSTDERLRWFAFDNVAGTERVFFVFTREPLSGIPIDDELVALCRDSKDRCPVRPSSEVWASVQKHLQEPLKTDKTQEFGKAQTSTEQAATSRGLGLAKDDPQPSVVMMASSPRSTLVATLDLIHK